MSGNRGSVHQQKLNDIHQISRTIPKIDDSNMSHAILDCSFSSLNHMTIIGESVVLVLYIYSKWLGPNHMLMARGNGTKPSPKGEGGLSNCTHLSDVLASLRRGDSMPLCIMERTSFRRDERALLQVGGPIQRSLLQQRSRAGEGAYMQVYSPMERCIRFVAKRGWKTLPSQLRHQSARRMGPS
jgi:hypothetical protein